MIVVWLFLTMPRVCLQFVVVVFPSVILTIFFVSYKRKHVHEVMCSLYLSHSVASRSEMTSCNKIDKSLVVYIFSGNVMTSITTLRTL